MRHTFARTLITLAVVAAVLPWSRPAWADFQMTGTVSTIKVISTDPQGNLRNVIGFNFTDPNQTATCADIGNGVGPKFASLSTQSGLWKETFALLLVSKKGASITCSVVSNQSCMVNACTLN